MQGNAFSSSRAKRRKTGTPDDDDNDDNDVQRNNGASNIDIQFNEGSASSSGSTDSRPTGCPLCTSRWSEKTLTSLSIKYSYRGEITPLDLIHMFPLELEGRNLSKFFMPHHIDALVIFFETYCNFNFMLDKEFKDITRDEANHLRHKDRFDSTEFLKSLDPEMMNINIADLQSWLRRFEACGISFGEILYSMVNRREYIKAENNQTESFLSFEFPSEFDFQLLFDAFVSVFGLRSYNWCKPIMPEKRLELSAGTVTGKADILYCQDISNTRERLFQSLDVVAVCEVKKQKDEEDNPVIEIDDASSRLNPNIPSEVLGQHGGNLLLYYDQSVRKDGVFGLLVQDTKVCFTFLRMSEDQFQYIKSGKKVLPQISVIITKSYDFMKREDRKYLIRPLLELALHQEVKFK